MNESLNENETMTIETLLNISKKLHEPSSIPKRLFAELRIKRIDDFTFMVHIESHIGHVLPGIEFQFDSNGKLTGKKLRIPKYTIFLLAIAWIGAIFLMFLNENSISSWPISVLPTILTFVIIVKASLNS